MGEKKKRKEKKRLNIYEAQKLPRATSKYTKQFKALAHISKFTVTASRKIQYTPRLLLLSQWVVKISCGWSTMYLQKHNVFTKTDKQKHLSWICCHVSNGQTKWGKSKIKMKKRFKKNNKNKRLCNAYNHTCSDNMYTWKN